MPLVRRACLALCFASSLAGGAWAASGPSWSVPILLYHRFGTAGDMSMPTAQLEEHLRLIKAGGYTVIPLRRLVDAYYRRASAPPPRSVVIVADDAHRSVYTEMAPLILRYKVPVTLFVYPSAVSNAPYAMTWDQLRKLRATGLVDVQSHTYWHPNFKQERRRLSSAAYETFVADQLSRSRARLEKEVGGRVDLLAWPFGVWDEDLLRRSSAAGYSATFTIARRPATEADSPLRLPRLLLGAADRGPVLARLLAGPRAPAAASLGAPPSRRRG